MRLRFPFRWAPTVATPSVETATPAPLWTRIAVNAFGWNPNGEVLRRFEHIYPEQDTGPAFIKDTDVVE